MGREQAVRRLRERADNVGEGQFCQGVMMIGSKR